MPPVAATAPGSSAVLPPAAGLPPPAHAAAAAGAGAIPPKTATDPGEPFETWWTLYIKHRTSSVSKFIANYIEEEKLTKEILEKLKVKLKTKYVAMPMTKRKVPGSDIIWDNLQDCLLHEPSIIDNIPKTSNSKLTNYEQTSNNDYALVFDDYNEDVEGQRKDPIFDYMTKTNKETREKWFSKIRDEWSTGNKRMKGVHMFPHFNLRWEFAIASIEEVDDAAASPAVKAASRATVVKTADPTAKTAASPATAVKDPATAKTADSTAKTAPATVLRGPVLDDLGVEKQKHPNHKHNTTQGDEIYAFNQLFTNLYVQISTNGSQTEENTAVLVYFYIIQSVVDTILLSMLIFNMGSDYYEALLYDTNSKDFTLQGVIDGDHNYSICENDKNDVVDRAIGATLLAGKTLENNHKIIIIKLYIIRYYRIVILNKICDNIQKFAKAIKGGISSIIANQQDIDHYIESIVSSIGSSSDTSEDVPLNRILGMSDKPEKKNKITKYSQIMYYKALINFAVSISLEEQISIEAILEQIRTDGELPEKIKSFLTKEISQFEKLYASLSEEMREPITHSIFTGLHSSNLFKETRISTNKCPPFTPTMDKYGDIYVKMITNQHDISEVFKALDFTKDSVSADPTSDALSGTNPDRTDVRSSGVGSSAHSQSSAHSLLGADGRGRSAGSSARTDPHTRSAISLGPSSLGVGSRGHGAGSRNRGGPRLPYFGLALGKSFGIQSPPSSLPSSLPSSPPDSNRTNRTNRTDSARSVGSVDSSRHLPVQTIVKQFTTKALVGAGGTTKTRKRNKYIKHT